MNQIIRNFIFSNYQVGEQFYTYDIYGYLTNLGYSSNQISSSLNNLKRQGVLTNQVNNGSGKYNYRTAKKPPKLWMRLK